MYAQENAAVQGIARRRRGNDDPMNAVIVPQITPANQYDVAQRLARRYGLRPLFAAVVAALIAGAPR